MRARLRRRGPFAALVALVVLVGLTVAPGYAAGLSLAGSGARPFATTQARCTNGPLTVSPSGTATAGQYTSVTVTGITGTTCTTGRVIVYGSTSPGTIRFNGTGTVSGTTMTSTSTAFTPPASGAASVYVTLNGWIVPATWSFTPPVSNVNRCEVRKPDGSIDLTKPCTIVGTPSFAFWGSPRANQGNGGVDLSAPGISNEQYVTFTLTITGAPAGWSWASSGLTSINNGATISSGCSTLPTFSGQLPPNKGEKLNVFVSFVENRTGVAGVICS